MTGPFTAVRLFGVGGVVAGTVVGKQLGEVGPAVPHCNPVRGDPVTERGVRVAAGLQQQAD